MWCLFTKSRITHGRGSGCTLNCIFWNAEISSWLRCEAVNEMSFHKELDNTRVQRRLDIRLSFLDCRKYIWLMIAFITCKSSWVPLLEARCTSNPYRFEFSVFLSFCRNRTDDLRISSPALWPTELVLHRFGLIKMHGVEWNIFFLSN